MKELRNTFFQLISKYSTDEKIIESAWNKINTAYNKIGRYYHNLTHLEKMFHEFSEIASNIEQTDAFQFAIFYHDIIYNILKSDNEFKSAEIMEQELKNTHFKQIELCKELILATKNHKKNSREDINYLIDIDLAILGSHKMDYSVYCNQIRKEYKVYPKILYNKGRRNVLYSFLEKDFIYHTAYFRDKYENKARENIQMELNCLG